MTEDRGAPNAYAARNARVGSALADGIVWLRGASGGGGIASAKADPTKHSRIPPFQVHPLPRLLVLRVQRAQLERHPLRAHMYVHPPVRPPGLEHVGGRREVDQ